MRKTLRELALGKSVMGDADDDAAWKQKSPPPWFDQIKFERGIDFFRDHISSILFSYLLSLIAGFHLDMFLQTLLFTGQSSSAEVSGKRYFATLLYIIQWYDRDLTNPSSKGYKSLMKVRRIHHHVRLALKKRQKQILLDVVDHSKKGEDGGFLLDAHFDATVDDTFRLRKKSEDDDFVYIDLQRSFKKRDDSSVEELYSTIPSRLRSRYDNDDGEDDEKLYLNQYEMGLVQSAFVNGIVLYSDRSGINASKTEIEDYVYAWRVFGWFLGIEDRFNICDGGFDDVGAINAEIRDQELIPAMKVMAPDADRVARAFIEGSQAKFNHRHFNPILLRPTVLITFSQRTLKLGKEYESPDLTYFDELSIILLTIFLKIMYYVPPFRRLINSFVSLPNVLKLIA